MAMQVDGMVPGRVVVHRQDVRAATHERQHRIHHVAASAHAIDRPDAVVAHAPHHSAYPPAAAHHPAHHAAPEGTLVAFGRGKIRLGPRISPEERRVGKEWVSTGKYRCWL